VRDDAASLVKLAELREIYEPFLVGLGSYYHLSIADFWPVEEAPDNWRTSAWARRAGPFATLGVDPNDDHFS
jgi:hypothetical protein